MPKSAVTAAFAVMMAATAPVAFAQTMTPPVHPMTPDRATANPDRANTSEDHATARSTSFTTESGKLRASEVIGSTVYDVQNRDIGKVKDIVLDRDGKVSAVVLDVGAFLGMGGKYVAVAMNDMKTDNNRLTLNRTKEQLQSAPDYQLTHTNG